MSREYDIRHVVRQHAAAETRANSADFPFTPAQACLVWWGLHLLSMELRKQAPGCWEDYPDTLRCYADAIEWVETTKERLALHARKHKLELGKA